MTRIGWKTLLLRYALMCSFYAASDCSQARTKDENLQLDMEILDIQSRTGKFQPNITHLPIPLDRKLNVTSSLYTFYSVNVPTNVVDSIGASIDRNNFVISGQVDGQTFSLESVDFNFVAECFTCASTVTNSS